MYRTMQPIKVKTKYRNTVKPKVKTKVKPKLKSHTASLKRKYKFGGSHKEILRQSLTLLIVELLPLAVGNYANNSKQSNAYAVTNIISEIRGIISQLESSIDSTAIIDSVNKAVVSSLRILFTAITNHLLVIKNNLPLKIRDRGVQKEIVIILDNILKELQKVISESLHDIDSKVSYAVNDVVKGKSRKNRSQHAK